MPDPMSVRSPSGAPTATGPVSPGSTSGRTAATPSFRDVLRAGSEGAPGAGEGPWALVRQAAHSIGRGERLLDRAVRAARRGHVFDHGELLALQAGVYRHTQELELAGKLVDKSTSAVRNLLSSQQ